MTDNNHQIIPPPELVERWTEEYWGFPAHGRTECESYTEIKFLVTQAARWGYKQCGAVNEAELQKARDEELEACCEWFVRDWTDIETADKLRAARRPKPPSLKEQALLALETAGGADYPVAVTVLTADQHALIRKALEALDD